jgi:hypothetical protein
MTVNEAWQDHPACQGHRFGFRPDECLNLCHASDRLDLPVPNGDGFGEGRPGDPGPNHSPLEYQVG